MNIYEILFLITIMSVWLSALIVHSKKSQERNNAAIYSCIIGSLSFISIFILRWLSHGDWDGFFYGLICIGVGGSVSFACAVKGILDYRMDRSQGGIALAWIGALFGIPFVLVFLGLGLFLILAGKNS